MTPKEKAKELYDKLSKYIAGDAAIKNCVLVFVDEIIDELEDRKSFIDDNFLFDWNKDVIGYWGQVKAEIQ